MFPGKTEGVAGNDLPVTPSGQERGKVRQRKTLKTAGAGCLGLSWRESAKIYISEAVYFYMTLEDFLKKSRKKGSIPLSYKEVTVGLHGTTKVEYENHLYTKAKADAARLVNQLLRGTQLQDARPESSQSADGLIAKLYRRDVVIHTAEGFHYGTLRGYDGKNFELDGYHFDTRRLDAFEYEFSKPFIKEKKRIIPAKDYISISRIPEFPEWN